MAKSYFHFFDTHCKCRVFIARFVKFIGFFLFLLSFFTHAASDRQIERTRLAAEEYILANMTKPKGAELKVQAADLDPRLKMTDCPIPLTTSANNTNSNRSNINVLVECESDNWRVYVPVKIELALPMVTALRPLAKGVIISPSDVTVSMITLQHFRRQGYSQLNNVTGAKVKRLIRLGDVVERNDICVVCRNEKVTIIAAKGGMSITTQGTALQDGGEGEQVRVKNDKSQRIIQARVTAVGEVSVAF
ncbi:MULTISPECIES: flagellar basal body P-ring formation chaperone FlgA [unclassified Vibrio]|uniref:Flagella basal body P-ring formation protein FlgA n=1 Tax=Vibrio sp. HB236076 TaxID=3232307 RepID=A0AB39HF10_9VIBR|nr:flagellar basal body P-ring formation chaperone FlgA [Vibrio sp. HB161653]MDP5254261.1 flagellar basal body P-ring formation chaperone FlgA [Vibrio sp. HB161653]